MPETLIPDAEVKEFLGIATGPVIVNPLARIALATHLRTLTVAEGTFVSLRDLERTLRSHADGEPALAALLHSVADHIVSQTGRVPQRERGDDLSL